MKKINKIILLLVISALFCGCTPKNNNVSTYNTVEQGDDVVDISVDNEKEYNEQEYNDLLSKEKDLLNEYKSYQEYWDNIKYYYEDEYEEKTKETFAAYTSLGERYEVIINEMTAMKDDDKDEIRKEIQYKLSKMDVVYNHEVEDKTVRVYIINELVDKLLSQL